MATISTARATSLARRRLELEHGSQEIALPIRPKPLMPMRTVKSPTSLAVRSFERGSGSPRTLSLTWPRLRKTSLLSGDELRKLGRPKRRVVLAKPRRGEVSDDEGDVVRHVPDASRAAPSARTTSTGTPCSAERLDKPGDVEAGRLGQLLTQVGDIDASSPTWRARASRMLGHDAGGEHAREQRPGAEHDLVGRADRLQHRRRRGGVGRDERDRGDLPAPRHLAPARRPRRSAVCALSTTAASVAGSTRPTAPRTRQAPRPRRRSRRSADAIAAMQQVPEGVARELAGTKAVLERVAERASPPASSAPMQRRRSPGAGMPSSSRRRPLEPPSSATETTAVISTA